MTDLRTVTDSDFWPNADLQNVAEAVSSFAGLFGRVALRARVKSLGQSAAQNALTLTCAASVVSEPFARKRAKRCDC